ncbi:Cupin domain-containing protein [Parafrankia irregularis]|uniref:Cupin domain-containing protein n=1 Tax=Parafrankia irregularis TaxID=795642 RepID=A0A0S4QMV4_9ACTN|nr:MULTISPECIES: XRE family transcriptional regulator [Parafrankia]MBE3201222.1 helix-turn-helix domain-containing protein [Parafrankia sp. CH37]CUU56338.1 Cupin domain-containing protein [Parafrankia irregularis]
MAARPRLPVSSPRPGDNAATSNDATSNEVRPDDPGGDTTGAVPAPAAPNTAVAPAPVAAATPAAGGPPPAMRAIGTAIRAARRRAGMPMTVLAERAGVSQPYLSQLENGRNNPSIQTLYRIANALELSPQDLLPSDADEVVVTRAGTAAGTTIEDRPDAAFARVLVGAPSKLIQVQEVTVRAGGFLGDWFEHDGEEFVYLLEGEVVVELQTDRTEHLRPGDAIWYAATTPHRWRSVGAGAARILVMSAAVPRGRPH